MTAEPKDGVQHFGGFPAGGRATAVPSVFFSELLPQIEDEPELRTTLYVIYALGRRKGYPRFVTEHELHGEVTFDGWREGLDKAVERGTLLRLGVEHEGRPEMLYFLNDPSSRRAVGLIREGRLDLGRVLPAEQEAPSPRQGNVFQIYEANIGALTPLVAEELREAEQLYPYEWLEEAMRESALQNKRSWRYVSAILHRWATEGRKREKAGRALDEDDPRAELLRRLDQRR